MKNILFTLLLSTTLACTIPAGAAQQEDALQCPYLYHTVNVITGEYCESETDLHLSGPEALTFRRCYTSLDPVAQGWHLNHPNIFWHESGLPPQSLDSPIHYECDEKNRLQKIVAKSRDGDLSYHTVHLEYPNENMLKISSESGDGISYTFQKMEPSQALHPYLLESVETSGGLRIGYKYSDHPLQRKKLLTKRLESNGRYLLTEYYDRTTNDVGGTTVTLGDLRRDVRTGRVKLQRAPVGVDDTPIITARLFYEAYHTVVYDALNNKTIYRYGPNLKLTAIENYLEDDALYRIERFFWAGPDQLTSRSIENADGVVLNCQTFSYDLHGNIIKQTEYGNLSGTNRAAVILDAQGFPIKNGIDSYSSTYRYSDDNRHLLLFHATENGAVTRYQYCVGSDRLKAMLTYDRTSLQMRQFYSYNETGLLVETIIDDGHSEDPQCLEGVTERKITRLHLCAASPGLGMPEVVEELYLNMDTGEEELLKRTRLAYTMKNQVSQKEIYDANGEHHESIAYEYDANGNVILTTDHQGNCTQGSYDCHSNLLCATTNDTFITNDYDFANRLIRTAEDAERGPKKQATCRYDYAGNKITSSDLFGNETHFEYDTLGRCIKTFYPTIRDHTGGIQNPAVSQAYDIMDHIIAMTDGNGFTTQTTYNARGKPTAIQYPDGSRERLEYNLDDSLRKTVAKNGVYTLYTRDFLSRVTREDVYTKKGSHLQTRSKTYSPFRLLSETDHGGRTTHYHYDGAGRQTTTIKNSAEGSLRTEIIYDPLSQVKMRQDWYGEGEHDFSTMTFDRDDFNNVSAVSICDAHGEMLRKSDKTESTPPPPPLYNYDYYNELGQNVLQMTVTDPSGILVVTTFNALNKPEKIEKINSLGQHLSAQELFYDAAGNKVRELNHDLGKDQASRTYIRDWSYGPNHRLESITEAYGTPLTKTTRYTYYPDGTLESTLKPDGIVITYEYTPTGKISRLSSSDRTIDYQYTYDPLDQAIAIEDGILGTSTLREYDDRGNIIREVLANGLTLENRYDLQNRRTELTLPDGSGIFYGYNAAFLTSVERLSPQGTTLYTHNYTHYNLQGKLLEAEGIGNSGTLEYTYDENLRYLSIRSRHWSETLEYDPSGNIARTQVNDPSGMGENTYSYGDHQQLTGETGTTDHQYDYDALFNRTRKNDTNYHVDTLNQLRAAGATHYTYDPNGNLQTKNRAGTLIQYEYDALNRMTTASQAGTFQVVFTYDAYNRRLSKTTFHWNTSREEWQQSSYCRYLYDSNNEIGSADAEGKIHELRILGTGLGAEIGSAVALELDGALLAPIHDHRGSVCCLTDATTGEAVEWYRYSAYGEETYRSGNQNPWRFSSKRADEETGLVYFGHRYYDAEVGRWTTQDPLGTPDGVNRYAFVKNQPLNHIDLYGLFSVKDLYTLTDISLHHLQTCFAFTNHIRPAIDAIIPHFLKPQLLYLAGYYKDQSETGTHGAGEINDKVRVTLVNGIMNSRADYKITLDAISKAHGGVNIHYIFDASNGLFGDLFMAFLTKCGYKSKPAYQLVETWRRLITEMDGLDGGGTIIHYAHSIGGAHTRAALNMLTPEERQMIRVYTFGSATIIPDTGIGTVVNFLSVRDVIVFCNPISFLSALLNRKDEIHPVGNWAGIPLVDHMLCSETYLGILQILGRQFLHQYAAT